MGVERPVAQLDAIEGDHAAQQPPHVEAELDALEPPQRLRGVVGNDDVFEIELGSGRDVDRDRPLDPNRVAE